MKLLLDTHVLLWWLGDPERLGPRALEAIADGANEVLVSPASVWEIEIKRTMGKLEAPDDLLEIIPAQGFQPLPIGLGHAWLAGRLPRHHADPFDRLLIAQAQIEGLTLVSADAVFPLYTTALLPANR